MAFSYTATVEVIGEGRNGGTVRSVDGLLEHRLSLPAELGGAGDETNPEQLFAAGWAACYLGALRHAASLRGIKLTSTGITAEVTLHHDDAGEFSLAARLTPRLGGVDQRTAEQLAEEARRICPYSKAVHENIPFAINAIAV